MTEVEWLTSNDPKAMGKALEGRERASDRVLRLWMASFWLWQSDWLKKAPQRKQLKKRSVLVEEWAETGVKPKKVADEPSTYIFYDEEPFKGFTTTLRILTGWRHKEQAIERAVVLLREVFGNPFATRRKRKTDPRRGRMFDPAWRTSTAVVLAKQMDEAREFSAMPILADALQDAGCDNDDILSHCRDPNQIHVRGCWVVDLVLGKE